MDLNQYLFFLPRSCITFSKHPSNARIVLPSLVNHQDIWIIHQLFEPCSLYQCSHNVKLVVLY